MNAEMATWGGNHVEQAIRLREAVRCLTSSSKPMSERLERAFGWLLAMHPHVSIMPPKQAERLDFILDWCASVRVTTLDGAESHFGDLTGKRPKAIIEAIIALYEACLIDLGRLNDDSTAIIYDGPDEGPN